MRLQAYFHFLNRTAVVQIMRAVNPCSEYFEPYHLTTVKAPGRTLRPCALITVTGHVPGVSGCRNGAGDRSPSLNSVNIG
jgi:hypothetical protein